VKALCQKCDYPIWISNNLKLKIYVQPNASRSEVIGLHADAIKIKIKAPPVDGAANEEVIRFLAEYCGVAKKSVHLLHGETGRHKLIEIEVDSATEIQIKKKFGL